MDVVIQTPIEHSADFKRSLHSFIEGLSADGDEGFTIYWAEPQGDAVLQHVRFDSPALADAFRTRWSREAS